MTPLGLALAEELRRFLGFLMPYLRRRLAAALGFDPAADPGQLASCLLDRTGRVFVTPTHVDLLMPLDQARIEVRLAGLDVDPGWVPALGRVIAFHFD